MMRCMGKQVQTMLILLAMAAAQESSNLKIQPEICDLLAEINTEYSKLPPINSNLLQDPRNYQLNIIDQNNYFIGNMVNFSDISCNVLTTNLSVKGQKTLYNDNVNTLKVIKSSLTKLVNFYKNYNKTHIIDYDFLESIHLRKINNLKVELLEDLHILTEELIEVKNLTEMYNKSADRWTRLKIHAEQFTTELQDLQKEEYMHILLESYIQPIIQGIIFITGVLGNAVLLVIFVTHKEILTPSNILLLNLVIGDIFSLVINLPLFYAYSTSTSWLFGDAACKLFRFTRHLGIGISVFSVTALSIQRFCATFQSSHGKQMHQKIPKVLVALVWLTACMFATPHTIFAGVYNAKCYHSAVDNEFYILGITMFEFIMICLIPNATTVVLTCLTAYSLSSTVTNSVKEGRRTIQKVTKILTILTTVSIISYVPFYLYRFLKVWYGFELSNIANRILLVILYTLLFGNASFNPIALYIVSHRFRYYSQKYFFRCCKELDDKYNTDLTSYAEDVSQATSPV